MDVMWERVVFIVADGEQRLMTITVYCPITTSLPSELPNCFLSVCASVSVCQCVCVCVNDSRVDLVKPAARCVFHQLPNRKDTQTIREKRRET